MVRASVGEIDNMFAPSSAKRLPSEPTTIGLLRLRLPMEFAAVQGWLVRAGESGFQIGSLGNPRQEYILPPATAYAVTCCALLGSGPAATLEKAPPTAKVATLAGGRIWFWVGVTVWPVANFWRMSAGTRSTTVFWPT